MLKKILKRIGKITKGVAQVSLGLVCFLVILIASLLATLWIRPDIVLNERNLKFIVNQGASYAGYSVGWGEIHIESEQLDFLHKRFRLEFVDLCVEQPKEHSLDLCIVKANVPFEVSLNPKKIKLFSLNSLDAHLSRLLVNLEKPKPKSETAENSGPFDPIQEMNKLQAFLPTLKLKVDELKIILPDTRIEGSVDVDLADLKKGHWKLNVNSSPKIVLKPERRLQGKFSFIYEQVPESGMHDVIHLSASARGSGISAKTEFSGNVSDDLLQFKILGGASYSDEKNIKAGFNIQDCKIAGNLLDAAKPEGNLDCRASIDVRDPEKQKMMEQLEFSKIRFPIHLKLNQAGRISPEIQKDREWMLSAKVGPVENDLLSTWVESEVVLPEQAPFSEFGLKTIQNAKGELQIKKFARINELSSALFYSVPAPLNELDGVIKFSFQIDEQSDSKENWVVVFDTLLKGRRQKLNTSGKVQIAGQFSETNEYAAKEVDLQVFLQDVQIAVPPVDIKKGVPPVIPDSRFIKKVATAVEKPSESPATRMQFTTRGENRLKILTPWLNEPIPVKLDLKLKDGKLDQGWIKVEDYRLEAFKRPARVEVIQLKLNEQGNNEILAVVDVFFAEYTITLRVLGAVDRPQIKIESNPPLPEQQAIAVLLFGKPVEYLDPEAQDSVGQVDAALADGAMSFASLYLLASTPIESVSYNPSTQTVSARVKLRDGTLLTVGGNQQQVQELGIRQRLGTGLYLKTVWDRATEIQNESLTTMLEKIFRY